MRYTVRKSVVRVIGRIWMPAVVASMQYTLSDYDVDNCKDDQGNLTRESVEQWLCTHSGDFQSVQDFYASLEVGSETVEIDWASEESEFTYSDCACEVAND